MFKPSGENLKFLNLKCTWFGNTVKMMPIYLKIIIINEDHLQFLTKKKEKKRKKTHYA